ncbi:MAG: hypothetical protein ACKOSS_05880 [Planctomycetia bacterium]
MSLGGVTPGLYVARDRARRFGSLLQRIAQDRRLAYGSERTGMATLGNEGARLLETLLAEARESVADVLAARLRDRERGYMDLPFVAMAEGLVERAQAALELERQRAARAVPEAPAQAGVLELVEDALRRADAFCATYDEKRPVAHPHATDLARLLERVERHARLARLARSEVPTATPPAAAGPRAPEVPTAADALEDLLRAVRALLPGEPGPWQVLRGGPGEPLRLCLGRELPGAVPLPPPERVARALRVLGHVQQVAVTLHARAAAPAPSRAGPAGRRDWGALAPEASAPPAASTPATASAASRAGPGAAPAPMSATLSAPEEPQACWAEVALPDPAAGSTALAAEAGAGQDARLSPEAERAVRALVAAPPLPAAGAPPPQRTVALLGLLRALDGELMRVLLPRLAAGSLRAAAGALPREASRKAPLRHDVLEALARALPGLPPSRVEDLVEDLARGKAGRKRCTAADLALLLALFGRPWTAGGFKSEPALTLAPWQSADVEAALHEAHTVGEVRRALEGGSGVEAEAVGRLERALVALLGRLGRLA